MNYLKRLKFIIYIFNQNDKFSAYSETLIRPKHMIHRLQLEQLQPKCGHIIRDFYYFYDF